MVRLLAICNKAYKFRLFPNEEQKVYFSKTFGCCRKIWNLMLNDKINHYKATGKMLQTTPAQYKDAYPYLKEVDSLALANVQINLQNAYKNFFRDKKIGFPKFKSAKRSSMSYTTNNNNHNKTPSIYIVDNKHIKLPKIGSVRMKMHRTPPSNYVLKSATISKESDGKYYVSILYEYESNITPVSVLSDNAIGLDYKSDGLYCDNNGNIASHHKYYRESQNKLSKAQRKLSRKVGSHKNEVKSNNYKKQQLKVAKIHKKIANQRLDFLHKLSTEIANQFDIVCVENLNMKAISNKGFHNGKATLDNGYGLFLNMLEYKLKERGKYLVRVDKWYPSSQICSCCGNRQKLELSERTYKCVCGLVIDRDKNAATNILKEGLRILRENIV